MIRRGWIRPRGGETAGLWLLILPYLIGMAGLVVAPALATIVLSVFSYDLIQPPRFVGFDNFLGLVSDDIFQIAARNSILFVAFAVPIRLIAVVGLALLLHRSSLRGGAFYRVSIFLPVVIPEVAFAIAWLWILNPLFGPLNSVLTGIGIAPVAWLTDPGATQWAMVLISCFTIGEAFVIAVAARRSVPADLYDLAVVDGASSSALLRFVTLPMMLPVLLLLVLRDAVLALQLTFVPSLIVTGGGPPPYATTYGPLFVYEQAFEYLRYGYAAAATAVFLAVTGIIVLLQVRILRRWGHWAWA